MYDSPYITSLLHSPADSYLSISSFTYLILLFPALSSPSLAMHCTTQHNTVLFCTVLYYTALYCTVLHCRKYNSHEIGSFMAELRDRLSMIQSGDAKERLSIYSAHDYTLLPLMIGLDILQGKVHAPAGLVYSI